MTTERDSGTRIVLSWLREDGHENAERVLLNALDEVDTTPQRRSRWPARRFTPLSTRIRFAAAAAAVVALAIVLTRFFPTAPSVAAPTDQPPPTTAFTSTPTAEPTPSPAVEALRNGGLAAGRYRLTVNGSDVDVVLTLGGGWSGGGEDPVQDTYYITSAVRGSISFWAVGDVGTDACDIFGSLPDRPVGPTVDDFVSALTAQRNSETTTPTTVTVGGHPGKRLEIRPAESAGCDELVWWVGVNELERGRGAVPDQPRPDVVYALDVAGQRTVVVAYILDQDEIFDDILSSMELFRG